MGEGPLAVPLKVVVEAANVLRTPLARIGLAEDLTHRARRHAVFVIVDRGTAFAVEEAFLLGDAVLLVDVVDLALVAPRADDPHRAVHLAVNPHASVDQAQAVGHGVLALAVLAAAAELALVDVAVGLREDALAVGQAVHPVPRVGVAVGVRLASLAVVLAVQPLASVFVACGIGVYQCVLL